MKIKLPNGFLWEYDRIDQPDLGAGPKWKSFLAGEIICLMCQNQFKVKVIIDNAFARPVDVAGITCPDCNAPILYLGTDNARAMLMRLNKRRKKVKR
jgi:hypothetical protein